MCAGLPPLLGVPLESKVDKPQNIWRNTQKAREFNRDFRRRLKGARLQAGMDEEMLAQKLGLPVEEYRRYESAHGALLPHRMIPSLCEILGIPIEALFRDVSTASGNESDAG